MGVGVRPVNLTPVFLSLLRLSLNPGPLSGLSAFRWLPFERRLSLTGQLRYRFYFSWGRKRGSM